MTQLKSFLSRYFYLCMSLVMAGLVVWGFSRTVDASLFYAKPPRPLLLWMHGAAFSTWVLFFIAQSTLIRVRKVSVHRTLGWFGAGLATVIVVLGLTVAVVMTRFDMVVLHQRGVDSFLSIPSWDMLVFGTCIALAILWRKKPDYHRRLAFVATCELITSVGSDISEFSRGTIEFCSFSEQMDTSTPTGRMIFTVLGAIAELERYGEVFDSGTSSRQPAQCKGERQTPRPATGRRFRVTS